MHPAGEGFGGPIFSSDQMSTLFDYPAYHTGEALSPTSVFLLIAAGAAVLLGGFLVAHR